MFRMACFLALSTAGMFTLCAAEPWVFIDNFASYADGSSGEPTWEQSHVGFAVAPHAMRAEVPGARGTAVLRAVPLGRNVALECDVTPQRALGKDWKTAGVGLWLDERNYWHLAVVEAPSGKHFAELSEMLDGQWNAHINPGTRLKTIEERGANAWDYGQTCHLRIALLRDGDRRRIEGEMRAGDQLRWRCVRALDGAAVDRGRPMLEASSMAATFAAVRARVAEAVAEPPAVTASAPPYTPGPLTLGKGARATGFYHVEADGQRWWLVDPAGGRTLSLGTDHVNYHGHYCESLKYAPYGRNVAAQYGSAEAWADDAARRLRAWNFNVLGAGCSTQARYRGLAHTEFLAFGSEFSAIAALVTKTTWTGWPDVFDPRFARYCELHARQRCEAVKNDPWLLGYFLDNELEWFGKRHVPHGLAEEACKLPATAAGKQALVASLSHFFGGDVAAFNAAFHAKLVRFADLLSIIELPPPSSERAMAALDAFIAEAASRYFQITTAAIRRHDPHHMIIGCRFAHDAPESAWRAAGATCDVVTVNVYPRANLWKQHTLGLEEHLQSRFAWCQKPLILTEWSFPALDAKDTDGRPLPSRHGAGMRVDTQEQKAGCYAIMQRELFALPFVVGSHWFMWADEPALGISSTFPEDCNYGLVSERDDPYPQLVATATRVNSQMLAVHAGQIAPADVSSGYTPPAIASTPAPAGGGIVEFQRAGGGYCVQTDRLRLSHAEHGKTLFDTVACRPENGGAWIELGSYGGMLNICAAGRTAWARANRVLDVRPVEQLPQRLVVDCTCACSQTPTWKAAYRLQFTPGRPWFTARGLWVENTSDRPWRLVEYYHYLPSRIGGQAEDDEPGVAAPNYWLNFGSWRDPALKLHYGALPPQDDERVRCTFWKDPSGQHPDCRRKVDAELAPGQRWTAAVDEPEVLVFGLQETPENPRPWIELLGAK